MASEDQVVIIPQSSGGSVPVPSAKDRADFVDKIKPEQIVEVIRHKLLGEEWNGAKWEKIASLQNDALSEKGAWEIANLMLTAGSINVSISKLKDEQIKGRLLGLIDEAMVKMLANWRSYNISDVSQFYYVKSILFTNGLAVLSQAGGGSIQELFKTTVYENRNVSSEVPKPSRLKSWLGIGGR